MSCSKCNLSACTCTANLCTNPLLYVLDQAASLIGTDYSDIQIGNTPVTSTNTIYTALYTILQSGLVVSNNTKLCCPDCDSNNGFYFLGNSENLVQTATYFLIDGPLTYPCCIEYKLNFTRLEQLTQSFNGDLPECCGTDFIDHYASWFQSADLSSLDFDIDYTALNNLELIEGSTFNGYSGLGIMYNYLQSKYPDLTALDYYGLYLVIVNYGIVVKCGDCNITIGSSNLYVK